MSRANVEIVRQGFEAFSAGDVETVLPFFAPDVVWTPSPEWPEDPIYRGHDGVRRLAASWIDTFDEYALEVHEIRDVQGHVLVLFEQTGRIKGSGAPIRQPMGYVFSDFRDGMVGEVRSFIGWQQALAAVGLAE
jgi:ketosteroid isomerase-like protein